MAEIYGIRKSAQHIAEKGYGQSVFGRIDAEDFYISLREAIESEYNLQGYCELIDNLLMGLVQGVDGIVYCAISNAGKRSPYKKGDNKFIPLSGIRPISWNQVMFGQFQFDINSVCNEIVECRKRGQRSHSAFIKKISVEETDISSSNQANDRLMKAKRDSDNIIRTAEKKASKIIESAEREARQSRLAVKNESALDTEMSRFGRKIVVGNPQETNTEDSTTEYVYNQQRRFRQECEREITALIEQNQKALSKNEEMHDQMCAKTNELQVAWMKSLTSATDQLTALKEDFYKHLRTWQQSLYPSEYEQLAERYIELYRIIDLDQVISDTMIGGDNNSATLIKLQSLDKSLHIFLHKFEVSMNGLGLYVYRAELGDDFDYVWHMNEDDSIDCSGKKVRKCITPGVAKRVQGDDEDDVIIPALVSV